MDAHAVRHRSVTEPPSRKSPTFRVLGVRVNAVQIPEAIEQMEHWIRTRDGSHFVTLTGMHGVMECQRDSDFLRILGFADLVLPDGMPLVWLGRRHGYPLKRRVYGPELMESFCRVTAHRYRHFLYGGGEGVPERLGEILEQRYQNCVVGTFSPPFRALTPAEKENVVNRIRHANPDVVWVGLSTPKQERWMAEFRDRLKVPVLAGVGAAFDFHTGKVKQAPRWMQENGLECVFRLLTEPRRLWRRYLVYGSQFAWNASLEIVGIKKFN